MFISSPKVKVARAESQKETGSVLYQQLQRQYVCATLGQCLAESAWLWDFPEIRIRKGIESPGNAPVIMEEVANHLREKLEAKEAMLEVAEDKRQLALSQICSKARTLRRSSGWRWRGWRRLLSTLWQSSSWSRRRWARFSRSYWWSSRSFHSNISNWQSDHRLKKVTNKKEQ